MDHKEILGNTIRKITQEKAAAINSKKQHCIAKYAQNNVINKILKAQAKKHSCSLNFIKTQNNDLQLKYLTGEHQKENALLAIHLVKLLEKQDRLQTVIDKIPLLISNTKWPGRFQEVSSSPKIIFDVCHNADSIKMFYQNIIKKHSSSSKKYLICGFEYNKEIKEELFNIAHMFKVIICTETNLRKSMKVSQLKEIFNNSSVKIECIIDPQKAINKAIQYCESKDEIYIIGSHFFGPFIDTQLKNCFAID
jgi:dihydrofolate synthase/folylpolyglutamate synthase